MSKDTVSVPEGGSCAILIVLCPIGFPEGHITRSFRQKDKKTMASSLDTDWDMDTPPSLNQTDFVTRARNASPSPPPQEDFPFADLDDAQELPLQKLIRYWMNERHAPDILPIQAELLAGILDHIHKQVRRLSHRSCAVYIEEADLFSYKRTVIYGQPSTNGSRCFGR